MANIISSFFSGVFNYLGLKSAEQWFPTLIAIFTSISLSVVAIYEQYGLLIISLVFLTSLTITLWLFIGILNLKTRIFPSKSEQVYDYAYGLDLVNLHIGYDKNQNSVQIGLILRNATNYPLKYEVESLSIIIGDRTIREPKYINKGNIICSHSQRIYFYPPFKDDVVNKNELTESKVAFKIRYGHPDLGFVRILNNELVANIVVGDSTSISYLIESEKDAVLD